MKYTIEDLNKIRDLAEEMEHEAAALRRDVTFRITELRFYENEINERNFDIIFHSRWAIIKFQFERLYKFIFTRKF